MVDSVYKEIDFATSLQEGPFAQSALAEAYRQAKAQGKVVITDFASYLPSYNAPAAFIAAPIKQGDKLLGVLAFQVPVDRINKVMTHNAAWQHSGLGKTGQSYLVGADGTMRSDSRGLIEHKDQFLLHLKNSGLDSALVSDIAARNTTITLLKKDGKAVKAAKSGQSGVLASHDMLTAYAPLRIGGLNWAIITEISPQEALQAIDVLHAHSVLYTAIAAVAALLVGALLGWLFGRIMVKPLVSLGHTMEELASGEGDLTKRLPVKGKDEAAQLANKVNIFIDHLDNTFSSLMKTIVRLVPISAEQADVNGSLTNAISIQKKEADMVNLYLEQTDSASKAVDSDLSNITDAADNGNQVVSNSRQAVAAAASTMQALSASMADMVTAIDLLKGDTDKIATVIDVINSISEQTNLLALNAAIEAARAGEAGRGFAVVADEVRGLAAKTRQSTSEVADMVSTIQESTRKVVGLMESGKRNLDQSSVGMTEATEQLESVTDAMASISTGVAHIAEAIASQQANFAKVSGHYDKMNQSFAESEQTSQMANTLGTDIRKLGNKLTVLTKAFKVTDTNWSTKRRNKIRSDDDD